MNLRAAVIGLAAVWIVAGFGIYLAREATPTAESVATLIRDTKLDGLPAETRRDAIDEVAGKLNRLPFEERQKLRANRAPRGFFKTMTPDEQRRFLDATLPAGFQQMMEAFNKMKPEERKKMVARALDEMQQREGEEPPPDVSDPRMQTIVEQGLQSFYRDASAETKLDLAPLIDQMQKRMRGFGR